MFALSLEFGAHWPFLISETGPDTQGEIHPGNRAHVKSPGWSRKPGSSGEALSDKCKCEIVNIQIELLGEIV